VNQNLNLEWSYYSNWSCCETNCKKKNKFW